MFRYYKLLRSLEVDSALGSVAASNTATVGSAGTATTATTASALTGTSRSRSRT